MSYGTSNTRTLRSIIFHVAVNFDGGPLHARLGRTGSTGVLQDTYSGKVTILHALRIVEEAVLGASDPVGFSILERVQNLAYLFDVTLYNLEVNLEVNCEEVVDEVVDEVGG